MDKITNLDNRHNGKYKTWAEIDLNALCHNYRIIRQYIDKISPECEMISVVKADAYGHGAVQTVSTLIECGCHFFAVSCTSEALELREKIGYVCQIIILGYVPQSDIADLIRTDITLTVFSKEYATELNLEAERLKSIGEIALNAKVKAHIKIDTGMNRLGYDMTYDFDGGYFSEKISDTIHAIIDTVNLTNIEAVGLFTHLACADEPDDEKSSSRTDIQYKRFKYICLELEKQGFKPPCLHICNSAGTVLYPNMYADAVRPGIILYGLTPSPSISNHELIKQLKPVMSLCSTVSHLHKVHKGESIGYGSEYFSEKEVTVATVPIGYADGFIRAFANGGGGYINGKFAPVVGRICMDQCMLEINGDVNVGDTVVFFGNGANSIDVLAKISGTINYELVCLVGKRVPRILI